MSDPIPRLVRSGRGLLLGFLGLLAGLLLLRWGASLYVEHLWFAAEGRARVFWIRTASDWGVRLGVGLLVGLATWVNLKIAAQTLSGLRIRRKVGDLVIQERIPARLVKWGLLGAAGITGLWFLAAIPSGTGLQLILFFTGQETGHIDPILEVDAAFYLFRYPVLSGAVTLGLVATFFVAMLVAAGYSATGAIRWGNGRVDIGSLPTRHLAWLACAFLLLLGCRFLLGPYGTVLAGNSGVQGIVGYADQNARIPGFQMAAFLTFVTAGVAAWSARRGKLLPVGAGGGALLVLVLLLIEIYPAAIQRFQVQPNELSLERPYISNAIEATWEGFGLTSMERMEWDYRAPGSEDWDEALARMRRLPVWTESTLLTTFREIDATVRYYDFNSVAFDRYPIGGETEPVAVSVREINPAELPGSGQAGTVGGAGEPSWENRHLRERFMTGVGAVAGRLNEQASDGRFPRLLAGTPPELQEDPTVTASLQMERPQVYVGSSPQYYGVVTPADSSFLAPDGSPGQPGVDFPSGIRMGSILRTGLFAWNFQDANLLLSGGVTPESRFLYRRDVSSRVEALAPFLRFPETPYPVIHDGRVVWIVEGFTTSRSWPVSVRHALGGRDRPNYVRNSVKATVDAVTGEVRFFATEPDDPLLQAWRRAFPGLVEDLGDMPSELQAHQRYSRWLMEVQGEVLKRYHQANPDVFHAQQDRWDTTRQLGVNSNEVPYRPEYGLLTLPGEDVEDYTLSTVFVPLERRILASFLAARWSPAEGGRLVLRDISIDDQVPGPRQVEALVEQDPEISQQFSLWRQGGSQVWTGHLHLVPVGETFVYMEPVFLAASTDAIPEIRRFVVSDGRRVVMDPTLGGAMDALRAGEGAVLDPDALDDSDAPGGDPTTAVDPSEDIQTPPLPPAVVDTVDASSAEALQLLEEAEAHLRDGDWQAFGRAMERLRRVLEGRSGTGSDR